MAADTFADAVSKFGASAKAKLDDPAIKGEPEEQLRTPLVQLFEARFPAANLVGETALADLKIRPDFAVTQAKALTGFIEVKSPGKGADPRKFTDPASKARGGPPPGRGWRTALRPVTPSHMSKTVANSGPATFPLESEDEPS